MDPLKDQASDDRPGGLDSATVFLHLFLFFLFEF